MIIDAAAIVSGSLAFALYVNTLQADLAYDDSRAIQKNPDVTQMTSITNLLFSDFWGTPLTHTGSHKSYRPLCVLTFRLNHHFGGLNPFGYHLVNVFLHITTTIIFTLYARYLFRDNIPTYISGLSFSSHPIHTEAVAGLVGRADVLACLFYLLSIICYTKYTNIRDNAKHGDNNHNNITGKTEKKQSRFIYLGLVIIFVTCSLLSKESGITSLGVCVIYDIFIVHRVPVMALYKLYRAQYRKLQEGVGTLIIWGCILTTLRFYFMGNQPPVFSPSDNPASVSDSLVTRILTFNLLPAYNFWLLVCPAVLSFDWSMESLPLVTTLMDSRNILTFTFYSFLLCIFFSIYKSLQIHSFTTNCRKAVSFTKNNSQNSYIPHFTFYKHVKKDIYQFSDFRIVILSLSFFIFPYIPASNLFFYVGFVIAERILYIPSIAVCLLIPLGANKLYNQYTGKLSRFVFYFVTSFVILVYCVKTVRRNLDWQTEEHLYKSGIAVNPAKAWGNLANVLNSQNRIPEAEHAYKNALRHRSNMADVHYNLGILLSQQSRFDESIESYRKAIFYRPKLTVAHMNLAMLLSQQGKITEAEQILKHIDQIDTSELKDPRLHEHTKISSLYNLGRLYSDNNRLNVSLKIDGKNECL